MHITGVFVKAYLANAVKAKSTLRPVLALVSINGIPHSCKYKLTFIYITSTYIYYLHAHALLTYDTHNLQALTIPPALDLSKRRGGKGVFSKTIR